MEAIAAQTEIIVIASHNHSLLERTCIKILELDKGEVRYFADSTAYFGARSSPPQ